MAEAKSVFQAHSHAAEALAARRRHHGLRRDAAATPLITSRPLPWLAAGCP